MKGLRAGILLGLSTLAALVCGATGLDYATSDLVRPAGPFFLTVAFLGAFALISAGFWQFQAGPRTRVFVMVLLAALAGGYTAANSLGLVAGSGAGLSTPVFLHWTGLAVGSLLYVASVIEVVFAIRSREEAEDG